MKNKNIEKIAELNKILIKGMVVLVGGTDKYVCTKKPIPYFEALKIKAELELENNTVYLGTFYQNK